jgi:hypothetical protein
MNLYANFQSEVYGSYSSNIVIIIFLTNFL